MSTGNGFAYQASRRIRLKMNDLSHNPQNIRDLDIDRERVDELAAAANEWLEKVKEIRDEETARRADDFLNQLTAELKRLDAERLSATEPLRKGARRQAVLIPRS